MRRHQWALALVVALAIHGSLLVALPQNTVQGLYSASADGDQGLEVGLGLLGAYQDQLETSKPKPVEEVIQADPIPEPVPEPPQPVLKPKPAAVPKPAIQTVKTEAPPKEALTVKEPEPATTQEPVAEKPKEPETVPEETSVASSEKATDAVTEAESNSKAMNKATGTQQQQRAGGRKGNAKSYFAELMAWLNQHKDYPALLKKQKQQGVVVLTFSINQSGEVTTARIKKSSGFPDLDQAALNMLAQANPVPAIPDSLGRDRLSLTIPVEYSLTTK